MTISWEAAGATHVGRRRSGNEDTFRIDTDRGIFLVADGMGGHAAGEIASELAAATVANALAQAVDAGEADLLQRLESAITAAQRAIVECCADDPKTRGMGTTLTACVLQPGGEYAVGHIGDSRMYVHREGALQQLTPDHTWVQREVDAGRLSREQARSHPLSHVLTRVLSDEGAPESALLSGLVTPGDLLLLVTDGLYNMVPDNDVREIIEREIEPPRIVEKLIRAANRNGGADNITVIALRVLD